VTGGHVVRKFVVRPLLLLQRLGAVEVTVLANDLVVPVSHRHGGRGRSSNVRV
jgi:hypothetical protein